MVIATYNRAELLPATIDSVLQQQFQDFELIIVNDGSTDDTEKRLEPYRERIRYLYQDNSGRSAARNAGVRLARRLCCNCRA
jgi:glycosyltransferase involved in cell wall biosynthesis